MAPYLIRKHILAELIVDCTNLAEAEKWSERIVVSLEDESGHQIPPEAIDELSASSGIGDISIEILPTD